MFRPTWIALIVSALFIAGPVAAQEMDQGEARITARADVRMGIESGPGTAGDKLQDMMTSVSTTLSPVRQCYATVTAERPTVEGAMRIRVLLARGRGAAELRFEVNTVEDRQLTRCVRHHLSRANFDIVERPANVIVTLDYANSAAAGVHATRTRSAEEAQVAMTRNGEGRLVAEGGTAEVRYRIVGAGDAADQVSAVHRGLRAGIAGLLDCRRRAGRRDMDPAGDVTLRLNIPRRGRLQTQTRNATVRDERAPNCLGRAIRQHRFAPEAAGRIDVTFTFAGRAHIEEARDD
ncbi:MAG: hypothetical protein JRH11_06760 [Deltaproteobacteria bacterium]|nr:hypothetical protein [Deltaproteobacteria bacterium]